MPTVTWGRVDPARRAAVLEAAEAEFSARGFSHGSLNVIARRAEVAKGSLFQYFADKADLYAFVADTAASECAPTWSDGSSTSTPAAVLRIPHRHARRLGRLLRRPPAGAALHAAASMEIDTDARISVRTVVHRHYLEVLRPLVDDAQARGDLRADADTGALLSLLLLIVPHLALALTSAASTRSSDSTSTLRNNRPWRSAGWSPCWPRHSAARELAIATNPRRQFHDAHPLRLITPAG